jgi:alpha-1,3-mannosylglycoprotein beta-1,4-N-acetylglucosaminyltransferase A/B
MSCRLFVLNLFFSIQLEDDIVATPTYSNTIKTFALQQDSNRWFMLEFSSLGFIGTYFT